MTLDERLLELLRCPACHEPFEPPAAADDATGELVCSGCRRRYPVRNGVPVLLVEEAVVPADGQG